MLRAEVACLLNECEVAWLQPRLEILTTGYVLHRNVCTGVVALFNAVLGLA